MPDKIIGILGGMGPEATADLFKEIIRLTPARTDQEHIPVLIYSYPKVPDRTAAILHGGEDPVPYLLEAARVLETAGAGVLAVPCNSAHYFLPRIRPQVGVPILDMIDETYSVFHSRLPHAGTVGLLATTGAVESGIYRTVFARHGVEVLAPGPEDQKRVHQGIQEVKAASYDRARQDTFESIGRKLVSAGAKAVIMGCTEIPLAFDTARVDYPVLNPTRILAQAAVDWALGKR